MIKLDDFIIGENINLCIPTEEFALNSDWYSWFNDKKITRYLQQGVYPNTKGDQKNFINKSDNRLVFIISNKINYIGTISLSNININNKTAEIALVLNTKVKYNFFSSLESIALVTEHAFESLGLRLISAGQHIELEKWTNLMQLAGYKIEGIHKNKFIKGIEINDIVTISCCIEDYLYLKRIRGKLWDGNKNFLQRIKKMKELESYYHFLKITYNKFRKKYYKKIFEL
jgi:RimJ/RimL family protein N-acetyltransferase